MEEERRGEERKGERWVSALGSVGDGWWHVWVLNEYRVRWWRPLDRRELKGLNKKRWVDTGDPAENSVSNESTLRVTVIKKSNKPPNKLLFVKAQGPLGTIQCGLAMLYWKILSYIWWGVNGGWTCMGKADSEESRIQNADRIAGIERLVAVFDSSDRSWTCVLRMWDGSGCK